MNRWVLLFVLSFALHLSQNIVHEIHGDASAAAWEGLKAIADAIGAIVSWKEHARKE